MFRTLIILAAWLIASLSAYAQEMHLENLYIIFSEGQTRSDIVMTLATPESAPANTTAILWQPVENDRVASHYKLQNGQLIHEVPAIASVDLAGFKMAVLTDSSMPTEALVELFKFVGTVNDLASNPPALQAAWTAIKAVQVANNGPLTLTCLGGMPVIQRIESLAAAHHLNLQ